MSIRKPLLQAIKDHPRPFILGMIFLVITNTLDGFYPLVMKMALDQIQNNLSQDKLTQTCFILFALMAGLALTRFSWRSYFGRFHTNAAEDLRQKLFRHVIKLSPRFFQKNPVGELMSLMTNDVQAVRQAIGPGVLILADGIIIMAVILPIMIQLNWSWTWKVLFVLPFVPFIISKVMKSIYSNYKIQQDRFSELTGFVQENIGGIRVIKSYAQEKNQLNQFNQISKSFEQACNKVALVDALFIPVMELGVTSGSVILFFLVKDDLFAGTVTVGTFIAFQRYIQKMVWPMTALGMGFSMLQKGGASFQRIDDVMQTQSEITDNGTQILTEFRSLEFKNVSFRYPDAKNWALDGISFSIQKGESLGILGSVGSGKTTLLSVLTRQYPLAEGQILINGLSIESYTVSSLRDIFKLIPQESFLFSESVSDNISYGASDEVLEKDLDEVIDLVDLTQEIKNLPAQKDSQLGERGINLSGGQKQRLTLARGLVLKSPVLLIDDSLSAIDTKTEKRIEACFRSTELLNQTRLMVAHRLSSLKSCQKVLVLKEGKLEYFGEQTQASRMSPTYQLFNQAQSAEAEHE